MLHLNDKVSSAFKMSLKAVIIRRIHTWPMNMQS